MGKITTVPFKRQNLENSAFILGLDSVQVKNRLNTLTLPFLPECMRYKKSTISNKKCNINEEMDNVVEIMQAEAIKEITYAAADSVIFCSSLKCT